MFYINYFNYLIMLIFLGLLPISVNALSVKKNCGKYYFEVKILDISNYGEEKFFIYQKDKNKKTLLYKAGPGGNFDAACVQNVKKQYFLLFQETCGGNGCPENVYGIYDPRIKRIIVNPHDWPNGNTKEVEKIIGVNNDALNVDYEAAYFFCCGYQIGAARRKF